MEKKFILPASTMLAGIIVWIAFLLFKGTENTSLSLQLLIGIASGGLIFFSGFWCKKVGGPRGGNIFRTALLVAFAVISYFLVGVVITIILLLASILTGLLIFRRPVSN